MAANKFETMLHRGTNKITLILIYAVLEWILIVLLLLNSLFSYLIVKFANYFGLKPPCLWCSHVDHIFEPGKNKNMHRDLLCEAHAKEISKLGYCSNHRKLAESYSLCEDCLSSRPDFHEVSKNFAFFPWMKQVGFVQNDGDKVSESDEVSLKCSCCGLSFSNKTCSPYVVIKPSWEVLDYTLDGNLIYRTGDDDHIKEDDGSDQNRSDSLTDRLDDEQVDKFDREIEMLFNVNGGFGVREERAEEDCSVSISVSGLKEPEFDEDDKKIMVLQVEKEGGKEEDKSQMVMEDPSSDQTIFQVSSRDDASLEILPQHLEFFLDCSGHRLVPVELIDSATEEDQSKNRAREDLGSNDHQKVDLGSGFTVEAEDESIVENGCSFEESATIFASEENEGEHKFAVLDSMEVEKTENSLVFHAKSCDILNELHVQDANSQGTENQSKDVEIQTVAIAEAEEKASDVPSVSEEPYQLQANDNGADVTIGTEIPDLNIKDEIKIQEKYSSYECTEENPSTSSSNLNADGYHGSRKSQESLETNASLAEVCEHVRNHQLSLSPELNEIDEEKVPDTPTSTESFHHLHKKLLLLGRKDSGTEDSLEGSVISEFEGGDGAMTIERLKAALKAERKALHALYAELEEERSASAVAASQTMAMINRLQEEKAAMQMEALQYQRMMEEQSEYDQEALQLLNELMVKREREKQELEKELEIYRKKLLDYDAKEKIRMLRRSRDGSARSETSSAYCSNTEDSDVQSIDLNQEVKEDAAFDSHNENGSRHTPLDGVLNLEESLADFEEERLSILEQLKALEEKLMTLSDEEEEHFDKVRPIEHEENGKYLDNNSDFEGELNKYANGFHKETNGKHHQERTMGSNAKRLLPLFDAVNAENGEGVLNGNENGFASNGVHKTVVRKSELENNLEIEEEVDHLYERLQALEADREFLKHCIGSLKKGDKGMDLLQEILQHLRDLRNVELRARNLSDGAVL